MSNFAVAIFSERKREEAQNFFHSAIKASNILKKLDPIDLLESEWVCAATFARKNGSGSQIANDPATKCWLFSIGTWFHYENFKSGEESILLTRYLKIGAEKLSKELEGFFVIVIGNPITRRVHVITDITGSRHCYIRNLNHTILLSSSSRILASLRDYTLDPIGCQEFLYTGIIYENRTFYNEIKRLEPASI